MAWQDTYATQKLTPQIVVTADDRVPTVGDAAAFDLDKMLSLDTIRVHTKTEDVPAVTDTQLEIYRKAALEAAEQYTGLLLRGNKQQIEAIDFTPTKRDQMKGYRRYNTQYPVSDGLVYIYGSRDGLGNRTIRVTPGTTEVRLPITHVALDASSCCNPNPCHQAGDWGLQIMYRAGYPKCEDVPSGILLGMLKYIAWNITHPGDEFSSVRNRESVEGLAMQGTNNISWASGAIELWRQYNPDAI